MDDQRCNSLGAASKKDYRLFIEQAWKDIHHSRVQEWSALGLVITLHYSIITITMILINKKQYNITSMEYIVLSAPIVNIIYAIIGILITMKHRTIMNRKIAAIKHAECKIGLIKSKDNMYDIINPIENMRAEKIILNAFTIPGYKSVSGLLVMAYSMLIILDILCILYLTRVL